MQTKVVPKSTPFTRRDFAREAARESFGLLSATENAP